MHITFHGAAQTTTGSMHLLEINGSRILMDCGLYQGKRKEAFELNRNMPFEPGSIDRILLSHAHIDHSGNLPSLVSRGFRGEIVATPATCDLCDIMLRDSAYLQERDVEYVNKKRAREGKNLFEPLYRTEDVERTVKQFRPVAYGERFDVCDGATAVFHDAGHLLGSAMIALDVTSDGRSGRVLFTGDLGQADIPILRNPATVEDVDVLLTESTYGNRRHPPKADVQGRLKAFIEDIGGQRAKLIIPSFSVGRTQQLVFFLNELYEQKRVPAVPVYVDSPLSSRATGVYEKHPECYDWETLRTMVEGSKPFQFRGLRYITDVEDSKALNEADGPAVIISASGMCEGGRILHHLKNNVEDPRNIVLFVGYQAEHTLGRRIVERQTPIRIFGEEYEVNARIHTINALSAHADRDGLLKCYDGVSSTVRKVFVIHGEPESSKALADAIRERGAHDVVIPEKGQRLEAL